MNPKEFVPTSDARHAPDVLDSDDVANDLQHADDVPHQPASFIRDVYTMASIAVRLKAIERSYNEGNLEDAEALDEAEALEFQYSDIVASHWSRECVDVAARQLVAMPNNLKVAAVLIMGFIILHRIFK